MNIRKFLLPLTLVGLITFSFTSQSSNNLKEINASKNKIASEPIDVSLIQLIATPEKYHNKTVRMIGYLNLEFEGDAIYLHEEDFKHSIYANSCWVTLTKEWRAKNKANDFSDKYVILVGTFDMDIHGHMDMFSGEIRNIIRLDTLRKL